MDSVVSSMMEFSRKQGTQEDWERFTAGLFRIFQRRMQLYTINESSSIRTETADELVTSICFLLHLYLETNHLPFCVLTDPDTMEDSFRKSLLLCGEQVKKTKSLYLRVCDTLPKGEHRSLDDTMKEIGRFFQTYDYHFFAHRITCVIDYPLCLPVSESLAGITYIRNWLMHLLLENLFMRNFPQNKMQKLLQTFCAEYADMPVNLYGPVAANAIGLALLRSDICALNVTPCGQEELRRLFAGKDRIALRKMLKEAALAAALQARCNAAGTEYLKRTAADLTGRIAACSPENMKNIFLAW